MKFKKRYITSFLKLREEIDQDSKAICLENKRIKEDINKWGKKQQFQLNQPIKDKP